jgi:hypothetical protein
LDDSDALEWNCNYLSSLVPDEQTESAVATPCPIFVQI